MVNISTRLRKLNTLLAIKLGPGAAVLPKNVTKVHMNFAKDIAGGHRGGRRFWRVMLPRLAYHNPSIPITVSRHEDAEGPSLLSVYLASSENAASQATEDTTNATPSSSSTESSIIHIDMKTKEETQILEELVQATGATTVGPSEEDVEMMRDLEEHKVRSNKDSVRSRAFRAEWKKQQNMLKAAREGAL